ncbi:hypothetical protein GY45DRAFT_328603 [Cubamyces sp. BRFM 1775]|nr:hypothetical protein GY45DRAFT_328603 [Cubamyces sp. BRFM 1775]
MELTSPLQSIKLPRIAWDLLEMRSAGNPLLPCLHTLHLLDVDPEDPVGVMLLLSPSIRHLVLGATRREHAANPAFIMMITSSLPNLLTLRIHGYIYVPPRSLIHLPHLSQLHSLNIAFGGIVADYDALQVITRLRSLKCLTLAVALEPHQLTRPLALGTGFLGLEHLHLHGDIQEIRAILLACEQYPRMQSFGLVIVSALSVETILDTFAIARDKLTDTAANLQLRILPDFDFSLYSFVDIFEPFFSLHKVNSFLVDFGKYFPRMNDHDMSRLATAWPTLTTLTFLCEETQGARPDGLLTIHGLAELARRCPLLEYLALPILDVENLPSPSNVPRLKHEALSELEVFELRGEETVDVASLAVVLDRLFPNLERPTSLKTEDFTQHNGMFSRPPGALDYAKLLMGAIAANRECEKATGEIGAECAHPTRPDEQDGPAS